MVLRRRSLVCCWATPCCQRACTHYYLDTRVPSRRFKAAPTRSTWSTAVPVHGHLHQYAMGQGSAPCLYGTSPRGLTSEPALLRCGIPTEGRAETSILHFFSAAKSQQSSNGIGLMAKGPQRELSGVTGRKFWAPNELQADLRPTKPQVGGYETDKVYDCGCQGWSGIRICTFRPETIRDFDSDSDSAAVLSTAKVSISRGVHAYSHHRRSTTVMQIQTASDPPYRQTLPNRCRWARAPAPAPVTSRLNSS